MLNLLVSPNIDYIFNKDIIFANNNSYLTFKEIDQNNKGAFNYEDLNKALSPFGTEGVSDFFKELSKTEISEEYWLKYIKDDDPYRGEQKKKISITWQERLKIKQTQTNRLFEDDSLLIIQPKSHKSMVLYGYDTKWCYASASTDEHYNDVKDESLFYIIFNKERKNKLLHKFILTFNKSTKSCLFEDQTNRLLTAGITYNQRMQETDENSIRYIDFLFKNNSAIKDLECSISSQFKRKQ